jgi:hypothetical protein
MYQRQLRGLEFKWHLHCSVASHAMIKAQSGPGPQNLIRIRPSKRKIQNEKL